MLNIFSRYFDQIITVVTGEFDCNYSVCMEEEVVCTCCM